MAHEGSVHNSERRGMKRPVEEVARAICNAAAPTGFRQDMDAWDILGGWCEREAKAPNAVGAKGSIRERQAFVDQASAVLTRLVQLGFLNDQYFEAKKAEESGDAGNVVDLTKGAGT